MGKGALLLGEALQQNPRPGKGQAYGEGGSNIVCACLD